MREAIRAEDLPLDVYVASDGEKAIEFINRAEADSTQPCPDYLLLDLNLPKRDGFEVLQHVRASTKCKDIPVLVMTSSDSPADQATASQMGAIYFRKPPDFDEFMKLGGVLKRLMRGVEVDGGR